MAILGNTNFGRSRRSRRPRRRRPVVASINAPATARPPKAPTVAPIAATPPAPKPAEFAPDSQYLADAAQRAFERQQKITQLNTESRIDTTDFNEALRRMTESRAGVEQQTRQTANKQGLFYSGQLGKRLGDVATDFTRRQSDAQLQYDRREAARRAAIAAIEAGAPLEEAAAMAAAADRQLARDQEAADARALAQESAPAPTPVTTGSASQPTTTRRRRRRPRRPRR